MRMIAAPVLALVFLGGCASQQLRVTYTSDPPGATLYQNGTPLGYTPYPMVYGDQHWQAGRCMRTLPISVQWASGATAGGEGLTFCPSQGNHLLYGFRRPDVAGREIDANFALSLQQANAAQRAASAQAAAANAQAAAANAQAAATYRALVTPPQPTFQLNPYMMQGPRQINCTSQRFGTLTHTNCY
jgi:hypothetical protein